MTEKLLEIGYDDAADVLDLFVERHVPYRAVEETDGLIWRYRQDSGEPLGVTVDEFRQYWSKNHDVLLAKIATFFEVPLSEVVALLSSHSVDS